MITPFTTPDKKCSAEKQSNVGTSSSKEQKAFYQQKIYNAGTPQKKLKGAFYQQKLLSPPKHDGYVYGLKHTNKKQRSTGPPDKTFFSEYLDDEAVTRPQSWWPTIGLQAADKASIDDLVGVFKNLNSLLSDKLPSGDERERIIFELSKLQEVLDKAEPGKIGEEANSYIEQLKSDVKDFVSDAGGKAKNFTLMVSFASAAIYYAMEPSRERLVLLGITGAAFVVLSNVFQDMSLFGHVINIFSNIRYDVNNNFGATVPQMGQHHIDKFIVAVTGLFTAYVTAISGENIPKSLFKNLTSLGRLKQTIGEIVSVLLDTCQGIVNWFRNTCLDKAGIRFLDTNVSAVEDFLDLYSEIREEERQGLFYRNADNYIKLKVLVEKGEKVTMKLGNCRDTQGAVIALRETMRELNALLKVFEASNFSLTGSRQEPVGILFKGGPGTGKSICMEHLVYAACAHALSAKKFEAFKKNPATFVFNRQFENKYWDGYNNEMLVTMFDDFGQLKDPTGNPDGEPANIIRAINGFQYNIHMANMAQKGNATFGSPFVFGNTNMQVLQFEALLSNEALNRRWDYVFIVVPKDEYCMRRENEPLGDLWNRKFDINKLPITAVENFGRDGGVRMGEVTQLKPDLQDFYLEVNGKFFGPYDFDYVVKLTTDKFDEKKLRYQAQLNDFDETLRKYRREPDVTGKKEKHFSDFMSDTPTSRDECDLSMDQVFGTTVPQGSPFSQQKHFTNAMRNEGCGMPGAFYEEVDEGVSVNVIPIENEEEAEALAYLQSLNKAPSYDEDLTNELIIGFNRHIQAMTKLLMKKVNSWEPVEARRRYAQLNELAYTAFDEDVFLKYPTPIILANMIDCLGMGFVNHFFLDTLTDLRITKTWGAVFEFKNPSAPSIHLKMPAIGLRDLIFMAMKTFQLWFIKTPIFRYLQFSTTTEGWITNFFAGVTVALSWRGIRRIFDIFFGASAVEDEGEPESFGLSDKMHRRKAKGKWAGRKDEDVRQHIQGMVVAQAGASVDKSGSDLFKAICDSNHYQFWCETTCGSGDYSKPGYLLFIIDRIAIMPYHFIKLILADVDFDENFLKAKIRIKKTNRGEKSHEYVFTISDILMGYREGLGVKNDYVMVKFPRTMQVCRNIIDNFALLKDYETIKKNIPFMMRFSERDSKEYFLGVASGVDKDLVVTPSGEESYKVRHYYTYKAMTSRGDCGAPFCVLNAGIPKRKIFGIHVAGNEQLKQGYAAAICQEDLYEDLKLFEEDEAFEGHVIDNGHTLDVEPQSSGFILSEDQFNVLGYLKNPPSRTTGTQIVKSRLHGLWGPALTGTAQLRAVTDNEGRVVQDPVQNALKKYCFGPVWFDRIQLETVAESYKNFLFNIPSNRLKPRILTWRETINGILDEPSSHGISATTSAGFPMNTHGVENMKKYLFEYGREGPIFEERILEVIARAEEIEASYLSGVRPWWLWSDCMKDERRLLEKIKSCSTRMFSGCPFYYLMITRRYCGTYFLQFIEQKLDNGSAAGENPFGTGWHDLFNRCARFDTGEVMVGAGDFSAFDGSEKPAIHYAILDIINEWYDDGCVNQRVRSLIWLEVVNSRHVIDGIMYEWSSSLPSGHPLTIIINCMYNHIVFRLCWVKLGLPLVAFDSNVYLCVMGDDNIFSVSQKYRDRFNELTLPGPMKELGLTYTTETKGEALLQFRNIKDVEFMKRGFRFEPLLGLVVAPLRLDVVLEIPYWTKKKSDRDNIAGDNTVNALTELALHGSDVYKKYSNLIIPQFEKHYPDVITVRPLRQSFSERLTFAVGQEEFF